MAATQNSHSHHETALRDEPTRSEQDLVGLPNHAERSGVRWCRRNYVLGKKEQE